MTDSKPFRRARSSESRKEKFGYTHSIHREPYGVTSEPMLDDDDNTRLPEDTEDYFKYLSAKLRYADNKELKFLWLDRVENPRPLFEGDRQTYIQLIEDIDVYLAATVFDNGGGMWQKTYLHGMLQSLLYNIKLLEIGAAPPVFYPNAHRPAITENHEAFKKQVRSALNYYVQACNKRGEANKRIAGILKKWEVKRFSEETIRKMKPNTSFLDDSTSHFAMHLPPKLRLPHNLNSDDLPLLDHALGMMAEEYMRRRDAIKSDEKRARGQRFNNENIRKFEERYQNEK